MLQQQEHPQKLSKKQLRKKVLKLQAQNKKLVYKNIKLIETQSSTNKFIWEVEKFMLEFEPFKETFRSRD